MAFTLTIVSVSDSGFRYLDDAFARLAQNPEAAAVVEKNLTIHRHHVGELRDYGDTLSAMKDEMRRSHMILLDLMGAPPSVVGACEEVAADYGGDLVVLGAGTDFLRSRMKLGRFSMAALSRFMPSGKSGKGKKEPLNMEKMMGRVESLGKVLPVGPLKDMRHWILLSKYWCFAGPENLLNMLLLICRHYGGIKGLPTHGDLVDYSRYVLFDPRHHQGFTTLDDLKAAWGWDPGRQTVGVLFHHFDYPHYASGVLSRIMDRLRETYNVVPLGVSSGMEKFRQIEALMDDGMTIDLLWDFLPFRFGAGPMGGDPEAGLAIFRKLGVPVMHPFFLGKRKETEWKEGVCGLSPMELVIQIMLPELDGVIDTVPVAALGDHPPEGGASELHILEGRLDKLMGRARGYLKLRELANAKKKIAFLLYNYPPGEGSVGGGAFLDAFASMERITTALHHAGYGCNPISADRLETTFMAEGVCNTAQWHLPDAVPIRWPSEAYLQGDALHRERVDEISQAWGPAPGQVMAEAQDVMIPGILEGNLFVGLQPSRGPHDDPSEQYHDTALPPHHQYLAFYRWLEHEFKADAVVHVGTHGTLEFLPGKESAMSDACFPDHLIGRMPHFYLYYSGNPAEATIAKRRIHGCLISHAGPPLKPSGLYGEAAELEGVLNELAESEAIAPERRSRLEEKLSDMAKAMNLNLEGEPTPDAIAHELMRMKTMLMPVGLHTMGNPFTTEAETLYLAAMLSWDRGEIPALESVLRRLPGLAAPDAAQKACESIIRSYYMGDKALYRELADQADHGTQALLDRVLSYGTQCLHRIRQTQEIDALLGALNGSRVEAKLGGDLIRDPEIFPTGHNLFQFDPRLVPSDAAMARGQSIAESTLAHYRKEHHGKWPDSVSVVLWGLETSRTRGETLCQVLAYLGVRITSTRASMEKTFEIIPSAELGRPRIDCITTICGFFRDMYPTLLDLLDNAFDTVASLNEPDEANHVRKHSRNRFAALVKDHGEQEAKELSRARIFGPPQGEYGTGITGIIESGNWQDETEIAEAYLASQKHIYTRNRRGEARADLFREGLKTVDLVSQVRSSADYTFTDLDHYYEFFGGLSRSVQAVRGEKPDMLITDSSGSQLFTDKASKAVELGVRTRLLNPEYIDNMLAHKVHGAQEINARIENLVGLSATTGTVDSWVFSQVKETYVDNLEVYEKLLENNRFAAARILERMLEAWQRGYWDATDEEIMDLRERYMELEGDIEAATDPGDAPMGGVS